MNDAQTSLPIDGSQTCRLFARPRLLAADDFLQREVARRLLERLTTIRLDATRVLDLGCGAGGDLPALRERFDGALVVGVDAVRPRLLRVTSGPSSRLPRFLRKPSGSPLVHGDFATLPFATHGFDMLWSNLALHWSAEPHRVLPEWSRVTRVGGLVAFSAFGPDTLREIAAAFDGVDVLPHVMPFTDMHDYGDMLIASGYTTPVVDMERLTLTYTSAASLWRDVRALGGNALDRRIRSLRGREFGTRVARALERGRDADGRLKLTFELVFAHAWKGAPRTTRQGETIVRVERMRDRG